jgi:hypothetical protein
MKAISLVLLVLGLFAWLSSAIAYTSAPTAIQQIAGICIGVGGDVLIGSAAIVYAIFRLELVLVERAKPQT